MHIRDDIPTTALLYS